MLPLKQINFIILHHSQRKINSPELIKQNHLARGFEDIGYHYLIDKKGNLYLGRSENFQGAHALSHNKTSLGVCLIGNFDDEIPSQKQIETLIKFLKEKMQKNNISVGNVLGHRELPNVIKTCPGKFVNMDKIREMVTNSR